MNRVYRLVWNRSLATVQVASELAHTQGSPAGTYSPSTPRRRPLALAIAAVALACATAPAWSQTCSTSDPSACGAPGGQGVRQSRNSNGGSGNGTGGSASLYNPDSSEVTGNSADSGGDGGVGAAGVDDGVTSTGGAGGPVGATGSAGLNTSVTGGTGGTGEAVPADSFVGGGGGGGGAGVFINDANSASMVPTSTVIAGGQGGVGGDAGAGVAGSGDDPGGGGGGGAGVIIGAGFVSIANSGTLRGGAGGAGGNGGYAASGGGGGDGLLVLGAGAGVTNIAGGRILGGAGGLPGVLTNSQSNPGGYGGGGAGVNLVGTGALLSNEGTITGGSAAANSSSNFFTQSEGIAGAGVSIVGAGTTLNNDIGGTISGGSITGSNAGNSGTPGVGVVAIGGASVTTDGSIAGGTAGTTQADSVLFSGGGNTLVIDTNATFIGEIQSTSGTTNGGDTLILGDVGDGSINAGLIEGFANNFKIDDSTWTLTGLGNPGTNWSIQQGQLVGDSNSFSGNLTFNSSGVGIAPSVDFNQAVNGTFAFVISGNGEVFKDGAGVLTLSGANTYTGGTTINAGILAVSSDANLGADTGTLILNGGTLENTSAMTIARSFELTTSGGTLQTDGDLTITGSVTGIGALNKTGAGTLILGGAVSFTGLTTVSAGTLQLDSTSLQGNIVDNAALVYDQAGTGTYGGAISGTGTLTKTGTGTVVLEGNDSYTGGTTISAGTLQGDTISLQGSIIDNASLVFNQINNGIFSGAISGSGTFTNVGNATLTLTGANTYTGGTTISAGTLVGDTTSLQGNITDNAALVFDQTSNGTYNGVISGSGALTTSGTGTLVLDGINTSTGLTTVAPGTTVLVGDSAHTTATVGGDVSVNGGTLGGYGTIQGSATLSNGATLTPGAALAIGTLTVNGDLTIGSGSQLDFDFGAPGANFSTPGQSDHVAVNGSLSIDSSTLNVSNVGSMGPGLYNLFTWGNALSISGGGFAPPSGMSLQILTVDKQINLVDTLGITLDEWDANGQAGPGALGGGSGTWSVASDTWSDTTGQFVGPMSPQPGFAIFGGTAGTVTVDNTDGQVSTLGMQFVSDGYRLSGDAIDLIPQNGVAPVLRVSSGDTAIVDNELDGTDGFNKTDGGTLVLTGTNLYTGTTTLSGGYVSVSSDANLGAAGDPLDFEGGALEITGTSFNQTARNIIWGSAGGGFDIDDAANTFTVAQTLAGTGGLLKSGAGTLVLAGANTYSGGTVIDAGTLQGDTTSLQGNITNNATLVFAQNTNGTFSGSISGSGQLIKNGGLELTLSGTNTYTGGTIINAGTLQGTTTSLQGNIVDNDDLAFSQNTNGTFAGVISGNGFLAKGGSGTVTLVGANTFTGIISVAGGTLEGDTASLTGRVIDMSDYLTSTTVIFNQVTDGTYTGDISGFGTLIKTGGGTLTLDGTNPYYTGVILISAGTLQGDTTSLQANIVNNAALIFDEGSDGTFSNLISGTGSLALTGGGTLILDGANTYTGMTTVQSGTLEIGDSTHASASIGGDVTVDGGGTLRGHGTIDGSVISDGIVWPGGSIGTLTIDGNYTQNGDGTLSLDITPSGASQLLVLGNANLAGTLNLIFAPGTYTTSTLTLLKANAVSGTFSTVDGTLPASFTDALTYTGTAVDLALSPAVTQPVRVTPLDSALYGNLMRAVSVTGQQTLSSVLDVSLAPCDSTPPAMKNATTCANGAWAQYTGSNLSLDGAGGLNTTGFGLLGGVDHALGDAHVGIEGGVNQLNGNDTSGGNGRVDSVHAGVYADADTGPIVLSGTLDGMHSDYHIQRATGVGAATSTPDGSTLSAAVQAAWPVSFAAWQLTPKVGALYQHQTLDSFSESIASTNELAADFPVAGSRSTYNTLQPYVAATMQSSFVAQGITYLPQLTAGYRYDTRSATPLVNVTAADGTQFALPSDEQGRGLATIGARITAQAGVSWNLYVDYEGLFANRLHDNALSFGFTKHF